MVLKLWIMNQNMFRDGKKERILIGKRKIGTKPVEIIALQVEVQHTAATW